MELSDAIVVRPEDVLRKALDRWYEALGKERFNAQAFGRMKSILLPYLEEKTGNSPAVVTDLLNESHKDLKVIPRIGTGMLAIIEAFVKDVVVVQPMQLADGWPVVEEQPKPQYQLKLELD